MSLLSVLSVFFTQESCIWNVTLDVATCTHTFLMKMACRSGQVWLGQLPCNDPDSRSSNAFTHVVPQTLSQKRKKKDHLGLHRYYSTLIVVQYCRPPYHRLLTPFNSTKLAIPNTQSKFVECFKYLVNVCTPRRTIPFYFRISGVLLFHLVQKTCKPVGPDSLTPIVYRTHLLHSNRSIPYSTSQ
jgi:hypothetical protein